MANDYSLPVRRAILTALKANVPLTALVPSTNIYPQSPPGVPTWPFIKYGAPSGGPVSAACVDGSEITVALHSFAKPRVVSGSVVETAEDHAARVGAFVAAALDRKRLSLEDGEGAKVRWTGSQLLQDPAEADAYHHVSNYRIRVIG